MDAAGAGGGAEQEGSRQHRQVRVSGAPQTGPAEQGEEGAFVARGPG